MSTIAHVAQQERETDRTIHPLILQRWSPRAMSGEPLSRGELMTVFEAARWAPSSYNAQPWRFVYALRGRPHFWTLFDLLADFNQKWAKDAGALVCIVSERTRDGEEAPTHSFDTGAAWQNLALQAVDDGLVVHAMEGFDRERARVRLGIPADHRVEAMVALGHPGDPANLPDDLADREEPSNRRPVEEFAYEGVFPADR